MSAIRIFLYGAVLHGQDSDRGRQGDCVIITYNTAVNQKSRESQRPGQHKCCRTCICAPDQDVPWRNGVGRRQRL